MLEAYLTQLTALGGITVLFITFDYLLDARKRGSVHTSPSAVNIPNDAQTKLANQLTRSYLLVYCVVMAADWLQGPYIYSLYKEQYDLPDRLVALLFVTGFSSAGFSGPLVGVFADKYGRQRVCLYFCIAYGIACFCTLAPWFPVLLFGRVVSGVATAILFSCFESHLISSAHIKGLTPNQLSGILGKASLLNGLVASAMGVVSNHLVEQTHDFTSPFMASAACLAFAYFLLLVLWDENYGLVNESRSLSFDPLQIARVREAVSIVRNDPSLLAIGLIQTCFEGSMYLFVFQWVPLLQHASSSTTLPLGIIFSCFMFSMMLGASIYTFLTSHLLSSTTSSSGTALVVHARLSSAVCLVAGATLAWSVRPGSVSESSRFWCFCAFEACVGMYYPVQAMLRGALVENDHRATLASLFRIPLNALVVITLLLGVDSAREKVLVMCAGLLVCASVAGAAIVIPRAKARALLEAKRDSKNSEERSIIGIEGGEPEGDDLDERSPLLYTSNESTST